MKTSKIVIMLALTCSFVSTHAFAKALSCQGAAERAAMKMMDEADSEGLTDENDQPRGLDEAEKASVTNSFESDEEGNEAQGTGIFTIELGVMEECLDGAVVKTTKIKNKKGKESCRIIEVKQFGDRDCG